MGDIFYVEFQMTTHFLNTKYPIHMLKDVFLYSIENWRILKFKS